MIIKRSPLSSGAGYCNMNVFIPGNYIRSDNREYCPVTRSEIEEVYINEIPQSDLSKQVLRLEELVEISCSPRRDNINDLYEHRLIAFYRWWNKWIGGMPSDHITQEMIGGFIGVSRCTVTRKLSELTRQGVLIDQVI